MEELIQERDALLKWMDANDSRFSLRANEDLRILNEKIKDNV